MYSPQATFMIFEWRLFIEVLKIYCMEMIYFDFNWYLADWRIIKGWGETKVDRISSWKQGIHYIFFSLFSFVTFRTPFGWYHANLSCNILQNLEIKKINDEKKASMAAQFAAEATLRRVHAAQKDDDMPPIEAILAPLEAELKLARQEVIH